MTEELATKLRHLGVKNSVVVGILMEHCLEYVVSYIAILRAGWYLVSHFSGRAKRGFCG